MSILGSMGMGDNAIEAEKSKVVDFCKKYDIPYIDIVRTDKVRTDESGKKYWMVFQIEIKCGGFVNLCGYQGKTLPKNLCFGNMFDGTFICSYSLLESMEGFPAEVGQLDISYSAGIRSMKGAPKLVNRDFVAIGTKLDNQMIKENCKVKGKVICNSDLKKQ